MSEPRGAVLGRLTIAPRFNGPPDSGNGGYVCGEVAKALESEFAGHLGSGIRVRLQQPPPLEKALALAGADAGEGCGLFDGDALVARGRPDALEMAVPDPVDFEQACVAAKSFRGYAEHVFPSCFVCGPERGEGDGLRIFPGIASGAMPPVPTSTDGVFAAPWRPHPSLALEPARGLELLNPRGGDATDSSRPNPSRADSPGPDYVDPAFVWAALDCPGAFCFPQPVGAIILLGEMTAALTDPVRIGEPHVLLAWRIGVSGRKHTTGTALYDADGRCLAHARAVWIEIPQS